MIPRSPSPPAGRGSWLSFHLFYHASRDLPLLELVEPLAGELWHDGLVRRFFFIRYELGGPHLRLRFQPADQEGALLATERKVEERVREFLERRPSRESVGEEKIRRRNKNILANDGDAEDVLYPDNTLLAFPPIFEEERYGGPGLLPLSLDFFNLSSLAAFDFVARYRDEPRSRRLTGALRALLAQATGHAQAMDDLKRLVMYAEIWSRGTASLFLDRADAAYAKQPDAYRQVVRRALEAVLDSPTDEGGVPLVAGAVGLSREVASASAEHRREIANSQLHMSANRMGLANAEEVYLGRILLDALEDLETSEPDLWRETDHALAHKAPRARTDLALADLVSGAMEERYGKRGL